MNQRDEYSHELISAYADGELSPDELARVEQLLATDDSHRQTLDEIKSLADEMRALPSLRLSDRFPQRVLEAARQIDPAIGVGRQVPSCPPRQPAAGVRRWQAGLALAAAATLLAALFYGFSRDGAGDGVLRDMQTLAKTDPSQSNAPRQQVQGDDVTGQQQLARSAGQADVGTPDGDAAESPSAHRSVASDAPSDAVNAVVAPAVASSAAASQAASTVPANEADAALGQRGTIMADSHPPSVPQGSSVATGADVPADAVPPPASSPLPGEQVPGRINALDGPPAGTQKMLFVINVELTRAGADEGSFERALNALGIAFDANIDVIPDLEQALLQSRFFEGTQEPRKSATPVPFNLVYVVTRGGAIDNLWRYMRQNKTQFARVTLDLAIKPGDLAVFEQLQQLANFAAAPLGDSGETRPAPRGAIAHRLMLSPAWHGMPSAASQGLGGLATQLPESAEHLAPGTGLEGGSRNGFDFDLRDGVSSDLFGGNIQTEALIVVQVAGGK